MKNKCRGNDDWCGGMELAAGAPPGEGGLGQPEGTAGSWGRWEPVFWEGCAQAFFWAPFFFFGFEAIESLLASRGPFVSQL